VVMSTASYGAASPLEAAQPTRRADATQSRRPM